MFNTKHTGNFTGWLAAPNLTSIVMKPSLPKIKLALNSIKYFRKKESLIDKKIIFIERFYVKICPGIAYRHYPSF
jgi:hypothetical protein